MPQPNQHLLDVADVLHKQHTRVYQAARAVIQHVDFIRPFDRTEQERVFYIAAETFLQNSVQRKPIQSETDLERTHPKSQAM